MSKNLFPHPSRIREQELAERKELASRSAATVMLDKIVEMDKRIVSLESEDALLRKNANEINEQKILKILNTIKLSQECWEADEDIMTFNGKPIGGTIKRAEIDRWWPELKQHLAKYLAVQLKEKI